MDSRQLSKEFIKEFLELYRSQECLWNTQIKEYNDRVKKQESYAVLIEKLKEVDKAADREAVIRKIDSFRSSFRKEIKKINLSKKSNLDVYKPRLWYFKHLAFLLEHGLPARKSIAATFHEELEQNPSVCEAEETIEITTIPMTTTTFNISPRQRTSPKVAQNLKKGSFYEKNHCCLDEFNIIGENIANKLRKLPHDKMIVAEKLINDILFEAQCGNVNSFTRINLFDMRTEGYQQTVTAQVIDS
ncbi:hypothetical protein CHUAL_000564 [Chamberlinius hualienensis]